MKLIFPVAATLSTVFASFEQVKQAIQQQSVSDRALSNTFLTSIFQGDGYGCWGNFNNNWAAGKGAPLDEFDAAAKELSLAYQCIEMELGCDAPNVVHNGLQFTDLVANCQTANTEQCAQQVCAVESQFNINVVLLGGAGKSVNTAFSHPFDHQGQCGPTTAVGGHGGNQDAAELVCCGILPVRFPFRNTTIRDCCGSVTYNNLNMQCCQGDVLLAVGDSCDDLLPDPTETTTTSTTTTTTTTTTTEPPTTTTSLTTVAGTCGGGCGCGTCVSDADGVYCGCPNGHSGDNCETIDPNPPATIVIQCSNTAGNNGQSVEGGAVCPRGWTALLDCAFGSSLAVCRNDFQNVC